jgi:acetyl-CoA/propionyl-CoA carboxylase biotin carboxyl carrier protein
VVPFHKAVLEADAFVPADGSPFRVHTRWIETEFADTLKTLAPAKPAAAPEDEEEEVAAERVVVEVGGRRLEVVLPAGLGVAAGRARTANAARRPARRAAGAKTSGTAGNTLASPMQGTIVKVAVEDGATVAEGDLVVVLEAMKMEQPILAHRAGTVRSLTAEPGAGVSAGAPICEIVD